MTLQIDLTLELEARLREQAAAAGKRMADVAREALEEKFVSREDKPASGGEAAPEASTERCIAALMEWAASHRPLGYIVDDSRESIYEGREE